MVSLHAVDALNAHRKPIHPSQLTEGVSHETFTYVDPADRTDAGGLCCGTGPWLLLLPSARGGSGTASRHHRAAVIARPTMHQSHSTATLKMKHGRSRRATALACQL